ncbi:MAG: hypothetical protein ACFFCW_21245 [Candidatus Hodarchaeota archaeon]
MCLIPLCVHANQKADAYLAFGACIESPYNGENLQSLHACIDLKKPFGPEELDIQEYNTGKRTGEDSEERDND